MLGVTTLSLHGRWPLQRAFVFEEHRLALLCWAKTFSGGEPATLLTLDRHFDLVVPKAMPPPLGADGSLEPLEAWLRTGADRRNVDHIIAAMELGLIADVVAVARSRPDGCLTGNSYVDRRGITHHIYTAPTLERLPREAKEALAQAPRTALDIDLDCFTSLSDADPTSVVPWPTELIRQHLLPQDSEPFWQAALSRCEALTLAREPNHCGGLVATGRLFENAARVVFCELLGADEP